MNNISVVLHVKFKDVVVKLGITVEDMSDVQDIKSIHLQGDNGDIEVDVELSRIEGEKVYLNVAGNPALDEVLEKNVSRTTFLH